MSFIKIKKIFIFLSPKFTVFLRYLIKDNVNLNSRKAKERKNV